MAVDEASRNALFNRLGEVLGRDEAVCLMELLPTVGRDDLATKADLAELEHRLTLSLGERLEREIRKAITVQTFVQCTTLVGVVLAVRA